MEGYPSIFPSAPHLSSSQKTAKNACFLRIHLIITPKIALIADRLNLQPHPMSD
jgi:hypothetical protein